MPEEVPSESVQAELQEAPPVAVFAPSGEDAALQPVWAKSQIELSKALGCDRKTVQRMMKIDGNPGKTEDGRYNITAWKLWCAETGHLSKKIAHPLDSKAALEAEGQRLKNEKLEMENALTRGELMHVDEVAKVLTEMVGAFASGMRGVKHTLAPQVVGTTTGEASKRIGKEVEAQLTKLSLGEWAKKKAFWSRLYAHLQDLRKRYNLGDGLNGT